ncbi:MAG TPA: TIGR03621 family F420-dependent LLM class oxidoreductase [Acidimicrobiales bacterium]|nr:TIGR03621 family F420-dependent LLM class oxidoreductase [Acidimicrobiales bacterium]
MKPFRFGVQLSGAPDGQAWRDLARKIECLGYSSVLLPDHLGDQLAPMVALTVAAEATSTLRVGTLVLDNDFRHPQVLAKEAATLDLLSEGRLELGIGAGWMMTDYEESGIPYDRPGVRVERLTEAVSILKALWRDGKCDHQGRHYQLSGAQGLPRPHSPEGPTLVIGGGSPRVLELAAREAAIVGVNPNMRAGVVGPGIAQEVLAARYDEKISWVRAAAGSRSDEIELQCLCFVVQVGPDRAEAVRNLAPLFGLSESDASEVPLALVGTVDQICETIRERRERWGFSYWIVHEPEMDAFAPVVESLAGT